MEDKLQLRGMHYLQKVSYAICLSTTIVFTTTVPPPGLDFIEIRSISDSLIRIEKYILTTGPDIADTNYSIDLRFNRRSSYHLSVNYNNGHIDSVYDSARFGNVGYPYDLQIFYDYGENGTGRLEKITRYSGEILTNFNEKDSTQTYLSYNDKGQHVKDVSYRINRKNDTLTVDTITHFYTYNLQGRLIKDSSCSQLDPSLNIMTTYEYTTGANQTDTITIKGRVVCVNWDNRKSKNTCDMMIKYCRDRDTTIEEYKLIAGVYTLQTTEETWFDQYGRPVKRVSTQPEYRCQIFKYRETIPIIFQNQCIGRTAFTVVKTGNGRITFSIPEYMIDKNYSPLLLKIFSPAGRCLYTMRLSCNADKMATPLSIRFASLAKGSYVAQLQNIHGKTVRTLVQF